MQSLVVIFKSFELTVKDTERCDLVQRSSGLV